MLPVGRFLLSPVVSAFSESPELLARAAMGATSRILNSDQKASLGRLYDAVCTYLDERKRYVGRQAFTAGELSVIARAAQTECNVSTGDIAVGAYFPCVLLKKGEALVIDFTGNDLRAHVLDVLTRLESQGGQIDGMAIANLADLVALQFMATHQLVEAEWPVRLVNPVDTKTPHMGAHLRLTKVGSEFANLLRPQDLLPLTRPATAFIAESVEDEDHQTEAML